MSAWFGSFLMQAITKLTLSEDTWVVANEDQDICGLHCKQNGYSCNWAVAKGVRGYFFNKRKMQQHRRTYGLVFVSYTHVLSWLNSPLNLDNRTNVGYKVYCFYIP